MVNPIRIKEVRFSTTQLTAPATGLFDLYSTEVINGHIMSVSVGSNTYTNTGSLLFFASGTDNGINNKGLILQLRAGSMIQDFYPIQVGNYLTSVPTSAGSTAFIQPVLNSPLRLVGSALGNGTSGLGITITYQ